MNRFLRQIIFCIGFIVLAITAFAQSSGLPEQTIPKFLGVSTHFRNPNQDEVEMLAGAGFGVVRRDISWATVEKTRGVYDFTLHDVLLSAFEAKGIRMLFILDYGNPLYSNGLSPHTPEDREAFAAYAGAAAAHYKGHGVIWEIWNEPNGAFWKPEPNATDYVSLAKAASISIKAADPNAVVIGPALSRMDYSFLEKCFSLGLLECVDAVSIHPYASSNPETVIAAYQRVSNLIRRYAPKDKQVPIVCSEWGYNSMDYTEEQQAQYLVREFMSNLLAGVRLSIWYDWRDDGSDPKNREHHFGIVYPDLKPKPSYAAMQTLSRELDGCKFVSRLGSKDDEYILLFNGPHGYRLAAWTTGAERNSTIAVDAQAVTLVTMGGENSAVKTEGGKLKLKLSQSPVYVEVGPSERMAMEEAITFDSDINAKWRLQDVIKAKVVNPLPHKINGSISLSIAGGKPAKKRFSLGSGKSATFKFNPNAVWDGQSAVEAETTIEVEGFDAPISRIIDLGVAHRITAVAACPLGRILEFRIVSPLRYNVKGKLKLFDVTGLKLHETSKPFDVDSQTVVGFTLDEEAPKEFSFGYELVDATKKTIFRSRVTNYAMIENFSSQVKGKPIAGYSIIIEGDENVAARVVGEADTRDTPYTALPAIPVLRLWYDIDPGHRFFRLDPEKDLPMTMQPLAVGMWIYGDDSGATVRCRFVDSTGQTFQPTGFPIDWKGWRYKTMPLDGSNCGWWGGAADGKPHAPFKWDTIFLLDTGGKKVKGLVYLGPIMLVSESGEELQTDNK